MKNRVAIIGNYAPHYRLPLWSALAKTSEIQYSFFAYSHQVEGIMIISQEEFVKNNIVFKELKNILLKNIVIWQKGILGIVFNKNFNHFIFNGDMYCLSTWLGAVFVKIFGRKVTFWGHGLYGDESWLKKRIRISFYRIPDYHLLYNNRGKQLLIQENFNAQNLYVVYNSLNYELQKRIFESFNTDYLARRKYDIFCNQNYTIIYTGRLIREKQLGLLIEALSILKIKGILYNLLLVGDGPERKQIMEKANKFQLDKVKFWGPCYDENIMGELYGLADLTVSPGNVGLTAVHSLSYGTPVITHNDFPNQMPEYEIIEDGITGMFFDRNNAESLAESICNWFQKNPDSSMKRQRCRLNIDRFYNPDYQTAVFNELITGKKRLE